MAAVKIRVTQSKHANRHRNEKFWRIEQETLPGVKRMFIYRTFRQAMSNADRIANFKPISTFGLQGFHIEGLY